ncbi:uncharacterized protein LOC132717373, partial [Ruditapes philippinarum]|uniref:uncharacterized protein LOC132717373 n=1 Tax=Ruditapes philippinarum TaxID=129788 RepID=UPI00295B52F1
MLFGLFIFLVTLTSLVECTSIDKLQTKIKNGMTTDQERFSFVAKIEKDGIHVCSCVLIDNNVAITLTSCVEGPLSNIRVLIKSGNRGNFTSTKIQNTMKLDKNKKVTLIELEKKIANRGTLPSRRYSMKKSSVCKVVGFS